MATWPAWSPCCWPAPQLLLHCVPPGLSGWGSLVLATAVDDSYGLCQMILHYTVLCEWDGDSVCDGTGRSLGLLHYSALDCRSALSIFFVESAGDALLYLCRYYNIDVASCSFQGLGCHPNTKSSGQSTAFAIYICAGCCDSALLSPFPISISLSLPLT